MKIIFLLIFDAAVQAAHQITAQTQLDKFLRNVSSIRIIILELELFFRIWPETELSMVRVKAFLMKLHKRPWKFDKYVCQNRRYTKSGTLCGREVGPSWNFWTSNECGNLKPFYFRLISIKTMRLTVLEE